MEPEEATQPTQNAHGAIDPRRMGRNNSGLSDADISDVMCILHPCSPAAFRIVASTAERSPQNVLQNDGFGNFLSELDIEEQETFIVSQDAPHQAMDLALRFSTELKAPALGFVFGRNPSVCDIVLSTDTFKRVSNAHFTIFVNGSGVLMLRDMSTNGTFVDDVLLKGKSNVDQQRRMLNAGSVIQILSPNPDDIVKFIVRIPSREGQIQEYERKFQAFMRRATAAELHGLQHDMLVRRGPAGTGPDHGTSVNVPFVQNQFGMHWSGGDQYNVVGLIGKGAFATVFQLATKSEGQLFAAKELEKRRFMKNGILDRKLDNEMRIMKSVSHPNIVQYVDYVDHHNHMYIIMEFVPCGDLQKYLSLGAPLQENLGKVMARQVLEALAYLHQKKITHRDIKPDNILLANIDSSNFSVKLSDFGLSKVVPDNDTFLKTFCGTLLYCAPEVFPHYDAHIASKGRKRPRSRGVGPQSSKFHSYSQSVDIWSFGAVLWYSLCLKPPFEGVADNNGRGMFDKIMRTPLDPSDLLSYNISEEAIALLVDMLNTDPSARPTPSACLRYRWFGSAEKSAPDQARSPQQGLGAIEEEEELAEEPDVSGLSLDEQESDNGSQQSELSIHSGSLEFFDPRKSKRVRSDAYHYRDTANLVDSSPEIFYQSIPIMRETQRGSPTQDGGAQPVRRKLFGEISQSNLARPESLVRISSNALVSTDPETTHTDTASPIDNDQDSDGAGALASPSLLGAESLVRELKMDSPHSTNSPAAEPKEPVTPSAYGTNGKRSNNRSNGTSPQDEVTPKQPQRSVFSRQIHLPIPASFYYEANDPSTHTLEYASKVSGHDYITNPSFFAPAHEASIPRTASASTTEGEETNDSTSQIPINDQAEQDDIPALASPPADFIKPPPRLGRLTSTPDSFAQITLNLTERLSMWGRDPSNTHVYPKKKDTRVPKRGIFVIFHAKDIDKIPDNDDSWTKLPDLHCVLSTESTNGIVVNGVTLKKEEPGKRAFGRIHTGDEILVMAGRDGILKFVCEFFHGEGKECRAPGDPFKIETENTGSKSNGHREAVRE